MSMIDNILFDVDSYKLSHFKLYRPRTQSMFSFIESRGGIYDLHLFNGLQPIIMRKFLTPVTKKQVQFAQKLYAAHGLPFDYDGWMYIVEHHNGLLPVRIRAVPEGTVLPNKNVLVTIESTDPKVFWAASWAETVLLRIWHTVNVGTISWHIKRDLKAALEKTCDDPDNNLLFRLHDFGCRGASSAESAASGGTAHLINFLGTDTVPALIWAYEYYDSECAGYSIPATEHSTITSWGRDREADAYEEVLKTYAKPGAIVACVSDSYDLFNAIDNIWGGQLRQQVIDSGALLVVRPDSGVPHEIVAECLKRLDARFGSVVNNKGFKVLNNVRVIQGDGVNHKSIQRITQTVIDAGFSIENVAFGMGGALHQQHDRDTLKFAMKCSSVTTDEGEFDVYKDPVTDPGKRSKRGRLDLVRHAGWSDREINGYETVKLEPGQLVHPNSCMQLIYENGVMYNKTTLDEMRARASAAL